MINETIKTLATSFPETPFNEVEEFGEVVHSVCLDAIKNADYTIDMYPYDTASLEDKLAAFIFTLQYACRGGFASLLIDFDPMAFDLDNQDLLLVMMSVVGSFIKAHNTENVSMLKFVEDNPIGEIPRRIFDKFLTYFSIANGYDNVPHFTGENMVPLQIMYYNALTDADNIDDSEFDMQAIYHNILQPENFNTSADMNTALLIIKTLYGRAFLANPTELIAWMIPDEGDTEIHPLPETLVAKIYTIHVGQLAKANLNEDQINAYKAGDIATIDPVLAGALDSSLDDAINETFAKVEDQQVAESLKGVFKAIIDTLIGGLTEYYSKSLTVNE